MCTAWGASSRLVWQVLWSDTAVSGSYVLFPLFAATSCLKLALFKTPGRSCGGIFFHFVGWETLPAIDNSFGGESRYMSFEGVAVYREGEREMTKA